MNGGALLVLGLALSHGVAFLLGMWAQKYRDRPGPPDPPRARERASKAALGL